MLAQHQPSKQLKKYVSTQERYRGTYRGFESHNSQKLKEMWILQAWDWIEMKSAGNGKVYKSQSVARPSDEEAQGPLQGEPWEKSSKCFSSTIVNYFIVLKTFVHNLKVRKKFSSPSKIGQLFDLPLPSKKMVIPRVPLSFPKLAFLLFGTRYQSETLGLIGEFLSSYPL